MTTNDENGFLCGHIQDWVVSHRAKHQEILDRAFELNRDCHRFLSGRAVPLGSGKHIAPILLFTRMLELYQSILVVDERGMVTATRILFRAFLEACFHFFAIHRDQTYLDDYMNQFHVNKRKLLKRIRESTSPAMAELRNAATDGLLSETERVIRENRARDIHIKEVSKRAKMYDTYLTAYAVLSPSVHTAVSDIDDHIVVNNVTGNTEGFTHGSSDKETIRAICLSGMTLAEALEIVSQTFGEDHKALCEGHTQVFKRYLESI